MKPSPKSIATLRWLLLTVAVFATLLVAFVSLENLRGDRAWAAAERELRTKGERIEFSAFQPLPVTDNQNFFKTPLLARVVYDLPSAEKTRFLAETHLQEFSFASHTGGVPTDLAAFRDHLKKIGRLASDNAESPAAGILTALRPLQPLLDELGQAAHHRPAAAVERGSQPFTGPWLDLNLVFDLGQALAVRASAELALDRTVEAFDDTLAALRLADGLSVHATLLELLVGGAIQGAATRPMAEGRERHLWSEPQLAVFQRLLLDVNSLAAFREAMGAQRAASLQFLDAAPSVPTLAFGHASQEGPTWPFWLFHGWAQQNKVALCRHLDDDVLSTFTANPPRIFRDRIASAQLSARRLANSSSPYDWIAKKALPHLDSILESLGHNVEVTVRAALDCALERHRLTHGRYPENLDALVPAFLPTVPTGIFDGQPLHYTLRTEGGHPLYSLGANDRAAGSKGGSPRPSPDAS